MMKKLFSLILPIVLGISFSLSCFSQQIVNIPIHFHVLNNISVSTAQLDEQIKELNLVYSDQSIPFRFQRISLDQDPVRLGTSGELNVNIHTLCLICYGRSTFPWDYHFHPELDLIDLDPSSLPLSDEHASGIVLAHEIGHWLGLYHDSMDVVDGIGNCMDVPNITIQDKKCYFTPEQKSRLLYFYSVFR